MKQTFFFVFLFLAACLLGTVPVYGESFRTSPKGVQYRDLQLGQGKSAESGDVVSMHFVAWLAEGQKQGREIYNSRKEARPVSFVMGTDYVMPGWNDGVLGMQSGGRRLLLVPPGLAWGDKEVDSSIPTGSSLMFVIEVLSVESPNN
ncbi:MAG: FKBP-type peptidyl-prolyl cis-trans isomerase [Gammaproteobacteria bacterium]